LESSYWQVSITVNFLLYAVCVVFCTLGVRNMLWQHGEEGDGLYKDWSDNTLVYCVVVFGKNDHVWVAVTGL
jgi:hypothetical protein